MPIEGLLPVLVVIGAAFFVGRQLFRWRGEAAPVANSLAGLLGSTIWGLTAIFIIAGGGDVGLVIGAVTLTGVIFMGSYHVKVLREEDLRATLGGQ